MFLFFVASVLALTPVVFADTLNTANENINVSINGVAPLDYDVVRAHRGYPLEEICAVTRSGSSQFPDELDLSESPRFPAIQNQGAIGSCVAFAAVYYQYSYSVNCLNQADGSVMANNYSPNWPYYSLLEWSIRDKGVDLTEVYEFLEEHGALKWTDDPYTGVFELNRQWPTNTSAMREALSTRVYHWNNVEISRTGTAITSPDDEDLLEVKAALNLGKVLVVLTPMLSDYSNYSSNIEDTNREKLIFYRCGDVPTGHAVTIVGYDDNITYDINGDGLIEDGERGAFKIANSHGKQFGNGGYYWMMYDALNGVSSVSGNWDNQSTRYPAFAPRYEDRDSVGGSGETIIGDNLFTYIYVEKKNPLFLAEINLSEHNTTDTQVSLLNKKQGSTTQNEYITTYDLKHLQDRTENTTLIFDYEEIVTSFDYNRESMVWSVRVANGAGNEILPSIVSSISLTDNLGNTIRTMTQDSSDPSTYSCDLTLEYGDMNYDGVLTSDDVTLIMNAVSNYTTISNTQRYLADYNGDGKVNLSDATALMRAIG